MKINETTIDFESGCIVLLNGKGTPAGDAFCRMNKKWNEVHQYGYRESQPIPQGNEGFLKFVRDEVNKSVDKNDVLIVYTTGRFPEEWREWINENEPVIGVVDATTLKSYYGCFAQFWEIKRHQQKRKATDNEAVQKKRKTIEE